MRFTYQGTTGLVPGLGKLVHGQSYDKADALVAPLIAEGKALAEEAPQNKPAKRAAPTTQEK